MFGAMRSAARIATFTLSGAWAFPVLAQTIGPLIREPDDVPGRRVIPEYTAIGYDMAGFDVLPTVTFGARFDDNIFSRTTVKESDIILQAEPKLHISRENRVNNIILDASARTSTYLKLTDQDSTEYRFEATYVHGTSTPDSITINTGYRREAIQRGTVENDLVGGEPLMRRILHGSLTGRKQFNRLAIDGQVLIVRQRHESTDDTLGGVLDQRFRNVTRYGLHSVVAYDVSGKTAAFASVEYDRFDYADRSLPITRDASSWSGTIGIRYEVTRLLYAQLGLGYRTYDFKDPQFPAIKGLAVSGHLRYFPSRLLAIRAIIEQTNTTSPYDLIGAVTLTTAKIETEYEMRRNLSWLASARVTFEDYGDADYSARRIEFNAGPRLRLNRWLSADANVGYAHRFVDGAAPFEPYSQFYGMVSLTFAR